MTKVDRSMLVGVEHEYEVRRSGESVDFRGLIHTLNLDGRRLDPRDPNAYRCRWGGVITADGAEAEVATPPVVVRPGFAVAAEQWTGVGRTVLWNAMDPGHSLLGYSTHISVSVPNDRVWLVARRFVERFSAPMMLLLDNSTSPGLLVRPRPGRLELCGDFVAGDHLRAATIFATGGVAACMAALDDARPLVQPPRLRPKVTAARIRPGYYIDRRAFGGDLYSLGRDADLTSTRFRSAINAQRSLEAAVDVAIAALAHTVSPRDLSPLERLVTGDLPLPCELPAPVPIGAQDMQTQARSAHGDALHARVRRGVTVNCAMATWSLAVFRLEGPRTAYVAVRGDALEGFLHSLDAGALDQYLYAFLAAPPTGRVLLSTDGLDPVETFDRVGAVDGLIGPETVATRLGGPRGPAIHGQRDKQDSRELPQSNGSTRRRLSRRLLVAVGAAVVLVALIAFAARSDSEPDTATASPSSTNAAAAASPTTAAAGSSLAIGTSGQSSFRQGVFTMSATVTVDRATATVGQNVRFTFEYSSDGPSTAIDRSTGRAITDCNPARIASPISTTDRADIAFLPVAKFAPGAPLDDAVRLAYDLKLASGAQSGVGTITNSPLTYTDLGSCRLRVSGTGSGQFTIPQLAAGDYWMIIPQTTVTRPAAGELSGKHAPPVPTTFTLPKITIS